MGPTRISPGGLGRTGWILPRELCSQHSMVCTFKPNRPRLFHFPTIRKQRNPTITSPLRGETAELNRPSVFFCLPPQEHTPWAIVFVNLPPTPSFHHKSFQVLFCKPLAFTRLKSHDSIETDACSGRRIRTFTEFSLPISKTGDLPISLFLNDPCHTRSKVPLFYKTQTHTEHTFWFQLLRLLSSF